MDDNDEKWQFTQVGIQKAIESLEVKRLPIAPELVVKLKPHLEELTQRHHLAGRRAHEADQEAAAAKLAAEKAEREAAAKAADQIARRRSWKTADGRFNVEADFVSLGAGKVKLRRVDNGKEISIDVEQLSAEDQAWVESRKR